MARKTLTDLELEVLEEWKKYYENPLLYAKKIKAVIRKHDPQAKILLFGSVVKGYMRPDSDIDVLVITKLAEKVDDRLRLRREIAKEIGDLTPFEIHIITPNEYKDWYQKFIDKHLEV